MAKRRPTTPRKPLTPNDDFGENKGLIELEPRSTVQNLRFLVRGHGWSGFPMTVHINDKPVHPQRILLGSPVEGGFRPSPQGGFLLDMPTRNLDPGRYVVSVGPLCNPK